MRVTLGVGFWLIFSSLERASGKCPGGGGVCTFPLPTRRVIGRHLGVAIPALFTSGQDLHSLFLFRVCLFLYCRALLVYTTSSNQQNQSPWTQSQRRRAAICSKWHSMSLCKCFQKRESKSSHLFLISFSIQSLWRYALETVGH